MYTHESCNKITLSPSPIKDNRSSNCHNILIICLGGSDDWAKGAAGIKFSYTVELPDTGKHGFILPPQHIIGVGEQATTVVKAALTAISK